jgi:hypothetical protein
MWCVHVAQQGWMPLGPITTDEIEQAFQRGDNMVSIDDGAGDRNHYMFQSMLEINKTDQRQLLRSADITNLDSSFHPWLFESDPMSYPKDYCQMNPHVSELLTMMRKRQKKHGSSKGLIHDYQTFVTYEFDIDAMTQVNKMTNTMRNIIPAPGEMPIAIQLKDGAVVPSELKCPISHEIMVDPVVSSDGNTYERYYFERWISGGKVVSPLTNLPLASITAYPNLNLKKLVEQFAADNAPLKGKKRKKS